MLERLCTWVRARHLELYGRTLALDCAEIVFTAWATAAWREITDLAVKGSPNTAKRLATSEQSTALSTRSRFLVAFARECRDAGLVSGKLAESIK